MGCEDMGLDHMKFSVHHHPLGGVVCTCASCGQQAHVSNPGVFEQRHRCTHMGMGDAVARVTGALGIKPCTPCEARRRALNGKFPRFWRR